MTQKDRLRRYLVNNQSIDPLRAWTDLGIYRLSAVIYILRREGVGITTENKTIHNRYGEKCVVANYMLDDYVPY